MSDDTATRELIAEAQGWCPECGGAGMVMEFTPSDCPNLDVHRGLDALASRPAPAETKTIRQFHGDDVWRDDEGLIWVRLSESIEAVEFARSVPAPVGEVEREELKAAIARYDRAKAESFHPAGSFDERSAAHAVVEIARQLEVSAGPWLPVPTPDNEGNK